MPFEHHLTARFYEIDRAGIVFYGRFYEYCHAALEELMAAMFGRPDTIFEDLGFGMPLVHSEADYFHPTRMGDRLRIEVTIAKRGTRSMTFAYAIFGRTTTDADETLRAKVQLVHCFVNLESFQSIDAPATFLEGLDRVGLN